MRRILTLLLVLIAVVGVAFYSLRGRGYRRVIAELVYAPYPDSVCVVEPGRSFEIDYFGARYVGDSSNLIDRMILCHGAWEYSILYFLRDAAESLDREDLVFLDIGANTGTHSLFMAQYVQTVHAFDPYPPVLARLEESLAASNVTNVFAHAVGLGEQAALLAFEEPSEANMATGSFVPGFLQENSDRGMMLKIVNGQDYLQEAGIERAELVKIDTECFEKSVLKGLRGLLEVSRPIVVMEVTLDADVEQFFQSREELLAVFPENYDLLVITDESHLTGGYQLRDQHLAFGVRGKNKQYNVVVVPRELADRIPTDYPGDSK